MCSQKVSSYDLMFNRNLKLQSKLEMTGATNCDSLKVLGDFFISVERNEIFVPPPLSSHQIFVLCVNIDPEFCHKICSTVTSVIDDALRYLKACFKN